LATPREPFRLLHRSDHDAALQSIATVLNGRPGLIGRYDLNSEFYRLQLASLFLNSSFGIGPEFSQSGLEGPSIFPNTSVGARFAIKPIEEIVLRTAALDGVPVDRSNGTRALFAQGDGVLAVTEAAYLYRPVGSKRPRTCKFCIGRNCCGTYMGKLALGAWYYSATSDDLTKVHSDGQRSGAQQLRTHAVSRRTFQVRVLLADALNAPPEYRTARFMIDHRERDGRASAVDRRDLCPLWIKFASSPNGIGHGRVAPRVQGPARS